MPNLSFSHHHHISTLTSFIASTVTCATCAPLEYLFFLWKWICRSFNTMHDVRWQMLWLHVTSISFSPKIYLTFSLFIQTLSVLMINYYKHYYYYDARRVLFKHYILFEGMWLTLSRHNVSWAKEFHFLLSVEKQCTLTMHSYSLLLMTAPYRWMYIYICI